MFLQAKSYLDFPEFRINYFDYPNSTFHSLFCHDQRGGGEDSTQRGWGLAGHRGAGATVSGRALSGGADTGHRLGTCWEWLTYGSKHG